MHWEGHRDQDTWEPARNLTHCADRIREFWESKGLVDPDSSNASTLPLSELAALMLMMLL